MLTGEDDDLRISIAHVVMLQANSSIHTPARQTIVKACFALLFCP
jgi:hypothetical protein